MGRARERVRIRFCFHVMGDFNDTPTIPHKVCFLSRMTRSPHCCCCCCCCLLLASACCFAAAGLLVLLLLVCWSAAGLLVLLLLACWCWLPACCFAATVAGLLVLLLTCCCFWLAGCCVAADFALLVACLASGLPALVVCYCLLLVYEWLLLPTSRC